MLKIRLLCFFLLLLSFDKVFSISLYRNYDQDDMRCAEHLVCDIPNIDGTRMIIKDEGPKKAVASVNHIMHLVPTYEKICGYKVKGSSPCKKKTIYAAYFHVDYLRYFFLFREFLFYNEKNPSCRCFWPESTLQAAEINNYAYSLFYKLMETTNLRLLEDQPKEQEKFLGTNFFGTTHFTTSGLATLFVCHSFLFSDYIRICEDLDSYCKNKYKESEYHKISIQLEEILEKLHLHFFKLYSYCLSQHESEYIKNELSVLESWSGKKLQDINLDEISFENTKKTNSNKTNKSLKSLKSPIDITTKSKKSLRTLKRVTSTTPNEFITGIQNNWVESQALLNQAIVLNQCIAYKEAIQILNKAIIANPYNQDAYIERAYAYFETQQLNLAIEDYKKAKNLISSPPLLATRKSLFPPRLQNHLEFSEGMIVGTLEGCKVSAVEFVPSTISSCCGILNGLWAFACSPAEVSHDMITAATNMGEFLCTHSSQEVLCTVIPELNELAKNWKILSNRDRGYKIGYLIGKYGVDIFAIGGSAKAVNRFIALKRANTMFTLETCAIGNTKQAKVLEEATKKFVARERLINASLKDGKILVSNANVAAHVMQKKHNWDKLIKCSGNIETDFKNVVKLLEENQILLQKKYDVTNVKPNIFRVDYTIVINNHTVMADFTKYGENGTVFLNNAWVVK